MYQGGVASILKAVKPLDLNPSFLGGHCSPDITLTPSLPRLVLLPVAIVGHPGTQVYHYLQSRGSSSLVVVTRWNCTLGIHPPVLDKHGGFTLFLY